MPYAFPFRFTCWHVLSVVCRLGTVVLSVITLQFGLKKVEHDNIDEDVEVPFYETSLYRYLLPE